MTSKVPLPIAGASTVGMRASEPQPSPSPTASPSQSSPLSVAMELLIDDVMTTETPGTDR